MLSGIDRAARALGSKSRDIVLRSAEVSTVAPTYIKVKYGGASEPESDAKIPILSGTPAVGDKVWIAQSGSLRLCLGADDDTGWVAVTFANSWVNFGGSDAPCVYRKTDGKVHLRGLAKNGTVNATMFTLPTGFRPVYPTRFSIPVYNGTTWTFGYLTISTAGAVTLVVGTNNGVSLDGISFFIDQ
jgi:hypothetical protein